MNRPQPTLRVLLGTALLSLTGPVNVTAGVIQHVEAELNPRNGSPPISEEDTVFELSSANITTDALVVMGSKSNPDPGYHAFASAGRFGTVGLDVGLTNAFSGTGLVANVLVGSDEFVNTSNAPSTVQASFVVDGGALWDFSSANSFIQFQLEIGADNEGPVDPETDPMRMRSKAESAAIRSGNQFYFLTLASDASGSLAMTTSDSNTFDLGATFDPDTGRVEIPFSLQSVDLFDATEPVLPGDRITVGYRAWLEVQVGDFIEGSFGTFADPFTIDGDPIGSGSPNPILDMAISFQPVPEPSSIQMLLVCLAGVVPLGLRRSCGERGR